MPVVLNPETIAMGVTAAADILQAVQQYSQGTITQEQAHAQFVAAHANLEAAVQQFQNAKPAS